MAGAPSLSLDVPKNPTVVVSGTTPRNMQNTAELQKQIAELEGRLNNIGERIADEEDCMNPATFHQTSSPLPSSAPLPTSPEPVTRERMKSRVSKEEAAAMMEAIAKLEAKLANMDTRIADMEAPLSPRKNSPNSAVTSLGEVRVAQSTPVRRKTTTKEDTTSSPAPTLATVRARAATEQPASAGKLLATPNGAPGEKGQAKLTPKTQESVQQARDELRTMKKQLLKQYDINTAQGIDPSVQVVAPSPRAARAPNSANTLTAPNDLDTSNTRKRPVSFHMAPPSPRNATAPK